MGADLTLGRVDPLPSRHMDGSETWTPPPEKKSTQTHKAIDFLVNTGTDPLENHKATQQVFRHWRAIGTGRKFKIMMHHVLSWQMTV